MQEKLGAEYGTFAEILGGWAKVQPDKPAIRDDHAELSWAELDDRIERLAAQLLLLRARRLWRRKIEKRGLLKSTGYVSCGISLEW